MTEADTARYSAYIARLNADELRGYWWALHQKKPDGKPMIGREPFNGEIEMIRQRERALGIHLDDGKRYPG
jgi:hypothetical protein